MDKKCTHPNCSNDHLARGLCRTHYYAARAKGVRWNDGKLGGRDAEDFATRLWRKIDRRGTDECWPWKTKTVISGYGAITRGKRGAGRIVAHRAVWELTFGPIPEGEGHHGTVVMHTCDNRLCCNPKHLRLGTQAENVRDMDAKRRRKTVALAGEHHGMATCTNEQIRAIKRDEGTPAEVARRHGVPVHIVKNIRYKNTWKDVE